MNRRRWLVWAAGGGIAAAAAALTFVLGDPPPPRRIRLATGDLDGAYYRFGLELARILQTHGLEVDVVTTTGSVRNAEMLVAREAEVAFAHAGITTTVAAESLRTIAKVYSEPIWVFYQSAEKLRLLSDLIPGAAAAPKRISIGADGSGTQAVALDLLRASGVTEENATFVRLDQAASLEAMRRGEIDVLIKSGAPTAPSIQALLHMQDVALLDFPNHRAYSRRVPYLDGLAIEEGMLSLAEDIPHGPISLLAGSAMLLTRADVHPRVVELVLRAAQELFAGGNVIDGPGDFPSARGLEVPQHEAALRVMKEGESWFSKNLSFSTVWLLSRLKLLVVPLLAVLPAMRVLPLVLGLGPRVAVNKRYKALQAVEAALDRASTVEEFAAAIEQGRRLEIEVRELALRMPPAYVARAYSFRLHADFILDEGERRMAKLDSNR